MILNHGGSLSSLLPLSYRLVSKEGLEARRDAREKA
jgi:hypothetical protein